MLDMQAIVILIGVVGLLVGVAYALDRRSKQKGGLLTGEREPVWKGGRLSFYLSLLIMLIGAGIFLSGFIIQSSIAMILGVLVGGGAYAYRFYIQRAS